ncbi:MAG: hypothetical protein IIV43_08645 [Oscillospiraceae bacterium]|nr:hypothetical protein [Oscillospiraceae bacterium]
MKLQNRICFLLGMVCIFPIINECKNFEGTKSALWVGFFLYMMIRCFVTAVTAFKKEKAD